MTYANESDIGEILFDHLFNIYESDSSSLTDRESKIFAMRYGLFEDKVYTLEELKNEIGVTKTRIRQILAKITRKINNKAGKEKDNNKINGECYQLVSFVNDFVHPGSDKEILQLYLLALKVYEVPYEIILELIINICYPKSDRSFIKKEAINLYNKKLKKNKKIKKQNKKFKKIFKQIICPNKLVELDKNKYMKIKPKRKVDKNGEGNSGVIYSNKINRNVEYESQLELFFIKKLNKFNKITWFVEQPFKIGYFDDKKKYYYPDFFVIINNYYPVVVEIKPRTKMFLKRNLLKYNALRRFCKRHNYGYLIIENNISINKFANTQINIDFKNEIINKLDKKDDLYWQEFKKIRNHHNATPSDGYSLIGNLRLEWTLEPFKISKTNDSNLYNFLQKNNEFNLLEEN